MSENERDEIKARDTEEPEIGGAATVDAAHGATGGDPAGAAAGKLSELMADGPHGAAPRSRPDLDADALRAAQQAIAEGERALAQARAQLTAEERPAETPAARRRELALRLLLAANVIAMLVVVMLPFGSATPDTAGAPATSGAAPDAPSQPPPPSAPRLAPKVEQALQTASAGDYAGALALLEAYLEQAPNMAPSSRINIYHQMAYYASILGKDAESTEYERKAQTLTQSHKLPDDLVASAKAALASGDQEGLRRIWARFLLQQRQIPSSLYQHVAEAYLQLGDSYRLQANEAAEQARLEELRKTEAMLREQAGAKERER